MGLSHTLDTHALRRALPGRDVRVYEAILSTEAAAMAWARAGAASGAVVAAGYQAAPRGRGGREWVLDQDRGLAFSVVVRPDLRVEREGWLYTASASGLADALGDEGTIEWPDEIYGPDSTPAGAVAVRSEPAEHGIEWAVITAMATSAHEPRAEFLASIVARIERRCRQTGEAVLQDYLPRCRTLGRRVRARLVPLGPGGPEVQGRAAGARMDGSLVIETRDGARVAVPPQSLGMLEISDDGRSEHPGPG